MDLDAFIAAVRRHDEISEKDLGSLLDIAVDIVIQEGTLLSLRAPITVAGDIHGQFYDLLRLFEVGGDPSSTGYIFLGDYVDRGYYSVETLALLIAYKVKYPTTFFLLRGNHESSEINKSYGFYEEVVTRFGHSGLYARINEFFDYLPLAAVIDRKIFCVHGGLSPSVKLVEQIALIDRPQDIETKSEVSDLVWSDPDNITGWLMNQRGAGYLFGSDPTNEFCANNRLKLIARAHQLAEKGYATMFDEALVTVWSAPNYMYRSGNLASVMAVDENLETEFKVFSAVPDSERRKPNDRIPDYFA